MEWLFKIIRQPHRVFSITGIASSHAPSLPLVPQTQQAENLPQRLWSRCGEAAWVVVDDPMLDTCEERH
jgi:hypothetical protein